VQIGQTVVELQPKMYLPIASFRYPYQACYHWPIRHIGF